MGRKVIAFWLSLTMVFSFIVIVINFSPTPKAADIWYVDDVAGSSGPEDPEENFTSIQDAINAANPGDTIFVYNGTYIENVVVDKMINLIGENMDTTIIDGGGSGDVIYVEYDQVNITGFSIIGGGLAIWDSGIELYEAQDCEIYNNNISHNNCSAIYLHNSIGINITNNIMIENGLFIDGNNQSHWNTHAIDTTNIVNNKPVYYWKNRVSDIIPMEAGQIILANCVDVTIESQVLNDGSFPIELAFSSNIQIRNNTILSNQKHGIYIYNSSGNNIRGNDCSSNYAHGVYIVNSNYNNLYNNKFSDQATGIRLENSDYNNIVGNTASQNTNAMYIYYSDNNNISANKGNSNWNYNLGLRFSNKNNVSGNDFSLSKSAFGIHLDYSNNNVIQNNDASSNHEYGIYLLNSNGNSILGNDASSNNLYGIYLEYSDKNTILGNSPLSDNSYGIYSYYSNNNNIMDNNASYNNFGIRLEYSHGNNITENTAISNNNVAIHLYYSTLNNISNNFLSKGYYGVLSQFSSYNNFTNNTMVENGIVLEGSSLDYWNTHNIDTSNTVNGKKVYYRKNIDGGIIPPNAGQVILANCSNITVKNQEITYTSRGITIGYSSNCNVVANIASNNDYGIMLFYSSGETIENIASKGYIGIYHYYATGNITNNTVNSNIHYGVDQYFSKGDIIGNLAMNNGRGFSIIHSDDNIIRNNLAFNNEYGIYLSFSFNNQIYHNDIIGNINQAYDSSNNGNQWDKGYSTGGNYWSDYTGIDLNSTPAQDVPPPDGIGDTPYVIDSNSKDNYPLMEPIENYTVLNQGWNLISLPLIQEDQNLLKVLEMINGSYDTVEWYNISDTNDPWKIYNVNKPFGIDLTRINEKMGFWIHITPPGGAILLDNGTPPTQNQTINLYPGWNLVGYPSPTSHNRTAGLNTLIFDTHVDSIWTYNTPEQRWKEIGPSDYFEAGRGYWIYANTKCFWEVPL